MTVKNTFKELWFNLVFARNAGEEEEMAVFTKGKRREHFVRKVTLKIQRQLKKNIREYLQSWFGLGDIELAELTTAGRFSRICCLGQLFGFWCASFPGRVSLLMGEEGQSLKEPCSSVNWGKNPTEFTESKIMAFCNQECGVNEGFLMDTSGSGWYYGVFGLNSPLIG